jgi:release factor glutamine methyltransferase
VVGGEGSATIGRLIGEATARLRDSGSPSPRLDAELLLGHVLGMDRAGLLAHPEVTVPPARAEAFEAALQRRAQGEPVAYIRGLKEFFGLAFSVDRRALIPRPETELLVELGVERVRERLVGSPRPADAAPLRIWDAGTGCGAIAVSVAVECRRRGYEREIAILASDASSEALSLATENAVGHGVADLIQFASADLLDLPDAAPADVLLANLPYIPSAILPDLPVAASFEPAAALDGGADGLAVIRRLLGQLPAGLAPDGVALLEIGADQADSLAEAVAEQLPGWSVTVHHDLGGLPRAAELRAAASTLGRA